MKVFILIISLATCSLSSADDGPWYDAKGHIVHFTSQKGKRATVSPPPKIVKKAPELGASSQWNNRARYRRSNRGQIVYSPRFLGGSYNWPNHYYHGHGGFHHRRSLRWGLRYRSSGVSIEINR